MADFVHLHVHSHYSLLDALPEVDELVKAAKKLGFKAMALTDHANLYGAIEFYEACRKEGIKPIIGVEAYITPSLADQSGYKENHLVLLAENLVGYKNLLLLVSRAHTEGWRGKPFIDKAMLRAHSAGLIGLSGCIDGEIASIFRKENNGEKAKRVALEYKELFGPDNFFLELGDLPDLSGQMKVNADLVELGRQLDIPLVVTRDAHYLHPDDAEAQDILTCIRDGRTLDEPNRPTSAAVDFSMASGSEIAGRFRHLPEALQNTVKIAERVDLKLELNKWHFAAIDLPVGKTADEHLRAEVLRRLPEMTDFTDAVRARVDYELGIIAKKGYAPYFLVVADYVRYAREHGIIETTRGSAAGSIVAYAMGITTVNPLYFKLPFERFLTLSRPSPPDVDADFADDRRDEMVAYVTKKYGADKVAQIITFGTMAARGSIRDVGRALGFSYSFCDHVSKLIPFGAQGFQMTIAKALDLEPELKTLYATNSQVKRLIDLAQKIEGCARHTSIHAAGVVIAPSPLTDFTPIQYESGGEKIVTQYEMHAVEAAGLLKMDFLGIRNLSILGHAVEIIEKTTGRKIDIYNLDPWDDKKTYDMLARGETVGVFQLAGSGMTRYLKELKPTNIFDIMAMVALFRPGPMESIPEYIRRKNNPEMIEYLDQRMKEYLDQSLGLIVYQDDVLLTAIHLAGYNWEEADKFRKAMGKKIPEEMSKQKEKFFKGCREFGRVSDLKIHRLWELIEPFAGYGFGKAHAASYAIVAYQTAYLKANFPIQYMAAVLIAESGDIDKVPPIIHECARLGIKVLPPDINQSYKSFAMISAAGENPAHIRFGLNGIKNLGEHIADVIYRERKENGQYKSLEDFLTRVDDKDLNKKSLESLVECGALDSLGYDRGALLANIEAILSFARADQEEKDTKQHSLFAGSTIDTRVRLRLASAPNATAEEKLTWEKELLGLYVTAHPFAYFQKILEPVLTTVNDLPAQRRKQWVVVGGVIDSTKKKITRKGAAMMFITIQDVTCSLELLVVPKTYETTKDIWMEGRSVCVVGRTSEEEGDDKLFVERAYVITKENAQAMLSQLAVNKGESSIRQYVKPEVVEALTAGGVEITLTAEELKAKADVIKLIFKQFPGEKIVYLKIAGNRIKTSYAVNGGSDLRQALKASAGVEKISGCDN